MPASTTYLTGVRRKGWRGRFRTLEAPRKLGQPHWDTNTPFEVVDKVTAPRGLGIVEEFKLATPIAGSGRRRAG